jgi:uncharacterized protein YbjQ (UPF0145 family)
LILCSTTETVPGAEIVETLGLVRGSACRTRHVLTDITEWFRNLVGMELHDYLKMMGETREQALDRMKDHALQLGADAVVAVRIETSNIASGSYEVLAYGTAVRLRGTTHDGGTDLSEA